MMETKMNSIFEQQAGY